MTFNPKLRLSLLAIALASAASTWAAYELRDSTYIPAVTVTSEETVIAPAPAPVVPAPIPVVTTTPYQEPAITITKPRITEDQRIQADVIDLLARNPNLSGKIGVESMDRVVTLSGYTSTVGQAYRAGRDARSVIGVRYVKNEIRPRVGGSVS
jgi:hypothetical protein